MADAIPSIKILRDLVDASGEIGYSGGNSSVIL
jgi:hypothetical protein